MNNTSNPILIGAICLIVGLGGGAALAQYLPNDTMPSTPATSMQHEMDAMTSGLKGKTGDAFDKAFLEEMIIHHQGAIDMANLVLQNSQRDEMKALANAIIEAQTEEIEMMRGWNDAWFNEPAMNESMTH